MQNTANMSGASGQNFGEKEDFKLEEKVTAESEGIRLLCKLFQNLSILQSRAIFNHMLTSSTSQLTLLQVRFSQASS